jgi:hypothetical protein
VDAGRTEKRDKFDFNVIENEFRLNPRVERDFGISD